MNIKFVTLEYAKSKMDKRKRSSGTNEVYKVPHETIESVDKYGLGYVAFVSPDDITKVEIGMKVYNPTSPKQIKDRELKVVEINEDRKWIRTNNKNFQYLYPDQIKIVKAK